MFITQIILEQEAAEQVKVIVLNRLTYCISTRNSGKNWSPIVLWYNMGRIENDGSNNSSLLQKRVYSAVAWQR
jgi:hypothetical protein